MTAIDPRLDVLPYYSPVVSRARFSKLLMAYLIWALITLLSYISVYGLLYVESDWLIGNYQYVQKAQIAWMVGVGLPLFIAVSWSSIAATAEAKR